MCGGITIFECLRFLQIAKRGFLLVPGSGLGVCPRSPFATLLDFAGYYGKVTLIAGHAGTCSLSSTREFEVAKSGRR